MTYRNHQWVRSWLILFTIVLLPGTALAAVRSINVDFGVNTQQTTLSGWNNFRGTGGSEPANALNLFDALGTSTSITLTPSWSGMNDDTGISGTAANYQGPYPVELSGIAQSALRDGLYVRDGFSLTLTLGNLPADTAYNFLFYGAAGNTGDYSLWTVTGSNSGSDFIADLVNNSDEVATVNGIIPDAMQNISIRFEGRRPDGSNHLPGVNDDGLGRFNYMRILQHSLVPGDFDANGIVDAMDYTAWRNSFGLLAHVSGADGNHNGVVDAADYVLWRKAMGAGAGGAATSNGELQSVPEPHAAAMCAMLLSVCSLRVRRRRSLPQ